MGKKERHSVKETTPSIHSISSSEVSSASDVSLDDGSSVHERSTPKIAAIIIVAFLVVAILVGVTVYFIDVKKFTEEERIVDVVRHLATGNKTSFGNNESLKQLVTSTLPPPAAASEEVIIEKETIYDEIIVKPNATTELEETLEETYEDLDGLEEEIYGDLDQESELSDDSSLTKPPRQRNKKLVASLNPIENFKAYPGRPGYSGSLSGVFENMEFDESGKPFNYQSSEKIPAGEPNNLKSIPGSFAVEEDKEPKNSNLKKVDSSEEADQDKIELTGIGIFGGEDDKEDDKQISEKISQDIVDDYVDEIAQVTEVKEFGKRKPGFRRKQLPKQQPQQKVLQQQQQLQRQRQQQQVKEEESVFTFRRGRLPPVKPTAAPTIGTSPSSLEDEDIGGIEIGGDLGDEEENLFYQGQAQRLIPNHVFESPSLPIRQQMGSFETHLRGGPFIAPEGPADKFERKNLIVPKEEKDFTTDPPGHPTIDRRPNRPPFHHMGPHPRIDQPVNAQIDMLPNRNIDQLVNRQGNLPSGGRIRNQPHPRVIPGGPERRGGPRRKLPPFRFAPVRPARPEIPPPEYTSGDPELPLADLSHLVTLAKEEVAVLREIARNISLSGKEVNLWEVMNAVNATLRENPNSPVAGLVRRFYQTYMDNVEEQTPPSAPDRGLYEKSLSSLIFLSFGIFLLNSVNDLKAKREGRDRTFGQNPVSRSLRALMSDRPEILQLFSADEGRRLGEPAGQSNNVNNYLRLLMNLMKVYSRSDSEEVDCVWTAYCHQLNLQAAPGGMSSTVARINSVGLKLALRQMDSSSAFPSVIKSLLVWEDLPCATMFPDCKTSLETATEEYEPENER